MTNVTVTLDSFSYIDFEICVLSTIKEISACDELIIKCGNYQFEFKNNAPKQAYMVLSKLGDGTLWYFNNNDNYITAHQVKSFLRECIKGE